ncbi:hypothetical protein TNIN_291851 [Trichonephila inaurata madagascariensis]|uniref:Uncharacterized protein n=1 Tax=Trichonephila inaurata madagascariensis TaxID=2747483 RepID=A0A8X7C0V7_9ARAC|nr:hypothetical protein TNIN_406941 [Trichonephila inaurata madagascariensis]GFY53736.1 hypothetical protein TNIN_291851 [Trichonephila inaurata madagascariensis]
MLTFSRAIQNNTKNSWVKFIPLPNYGIYLNNSYRMYYNCIVAAKGPKTRNLGNPWEFEREVQRHVRCQLTIMKRRDGNSQLLSRSRVTSDFGELSQQECPMKLERNSNSRCNSIVLH